MHNTNFTIGMLVAFQMFSGRLSDPVLRLVGLWQEFQQADIAVKRLGDVMNAPTEPMTLIPIEIGLISPYSSTKYGRDITGCVLPGSINLAY